MILDESTGREKIKLLLVDDEPKNLFTLKELLEPLNEIIITADSGKEALKQILQHDFAVVMLDVKMPEISGHDVAQLMRQRPQTRETPIIFITGQQEDRLAVHRGYELGAVDYLIKPLEEKVLLSKIRVFVELHRKTVALEHQKEIALAELRKNKLLLRTNLDLERLKKEAEQFAYIASHDLQTPLRHIASFVEVLRDSANGELTDAQKEAIDIIASGTQRMKRLIRDLLELSRIGRQSVNFAQVELNDLVLEVLDSLNKEITESGAKIVTKPLPTVPIDRVKIRQVFQNLIGNALKYQAKDRCTEITISAEPKGDNFEICIQDNGIGIDQRHFERIFEIFQRLHPEVTYPGTGIGLAICKKIIELHNGEIRVESNPGKGSRFFFSLPTNLKEKAYEHGTQDSLG